MWSKTRYAADPEYRTHILKGVKERHEKLKNNPTYHRLCYVRRKITRRRDTIEIYLNKIQKLEKNLINLIKKRDKLALKFKEERNATRFNKR